MDPRPGRMIRHDLRNSLMIALGNLRIITVMLKSDGATPDLSLVEGRANKAEAALRQAEIFVAEWAATAEDKHPQP